MNQKPVIAIVGGGFCGSITLVQLLKQSDIPLEIVLVNKNNPITTGIAFSSYNPKHVLNVPAAKMSAFPDDPDNFLNWVKSKPEYREYVNEELNDRFLPRVIYGKYLEEIFDNAINDLPENVTVKIINDEVLDVNVSSSGAELILKENKSFKADKVVLALGNFLPDDPRIQNKSFYQSKRYFNDPWRKQAVEGLDESDKVLIIGTGLTMVDNVYSLLDKGFNGKIYALSTNGYFPLSHKKRKPYTDILDEIHPPYEISSLFKIFRKHIKYVLSHGITGEAVVDAIRPKTQEIWLSLSLDDKIKFMAHIRHLWGVARHRLPKEIFDHMQNLMRDGKLEIIGGRIQDIREDNEEITVTYKERKSQLIKELKVNRVINCTGPKTDLNRVDEALVSNLLKKGLICCDEMKLGINALPDGTIIQNDNSISPVLYTIGSMLKGILWESTAVPELRVQARSMAGELIKQLEQKQEANA
ncbi:MAG: FAD/NAD(P)-binding protein [Ignavibacteria bacterium]|nr:FAD/NAD(P)-binding protein [Ignavibacteria bacterium]